MFRLTTLQIKRTCVAAYVRREADLVISCCLVRTQYWEALDRFDWRGEEWQLTCVIVVAILRTCCCCCCVSRTSPDCVALVKVGRIARQINARLSFPLTHSSVIHRFQLLISSGFNYFSWLRNLCWPRVVLLDNFVRYFCCFFVEW